METLDPNPEHAQQEAADTAFRRSETYSFRGEKLQPYSFLRQTAAEALGLAYFSLSPEQIKSRPNPAKELLTNGTALTDEERSIIEAQGDEIFTYAGMVRDAAIVHWLCSQDDETCRKARANPAKFEPHIDRWADDNGLNVAGPARGEALKTFSEILADVAASRAVPDIPKGDGASANAPKNE